MAPVACSTGMFEEIRYSRGRIRVHVFFTTPVEKITRPRSILKKKFVSELEYDGGDAGNHCSRHNGQQYFVEEGVHFAL